MKNIKYNFSLATPKQKKQPESIKIGKVKDEKTYMIHLLQGHSCSDREVSDKPDDGTHFRPDERGFFIWWQYRARGAYAFVPSLIQGGARWNRGSRRHSALSSAFLTQLSVDAVQRSPVVMEVNRGSLAKFLTRENSLCSLLRPSRDSRERKKRKERKKKKRSPRLLQPCSVTRSSTTEQVAFENVKLVGRTREDPQEL